MNVSSADIVGKDPLFPVVESVWHHPVATDTRCARLGQCAQALGSSHGDQAGLDICSECSQPGLKVCDLVQGIERSKQEKIPALDLGTLPNAGPTRRGPVEEEGAWSPELIEFLQPLRLSLQATAVSRKRRGTGNLGCSLRELLLFTA